MQTGQSINLPASYQALLQNYTQTSTGFSTSLSYPIKRSFKRVGITYSFDNTTLQTYSAASTLYFESLAFRGLSGPNALTGIQTSKVVPNFSYNRIDNPQRPHSGQSLLFATEIAGLGGNTHYIKPVVEWKKFRPMKKGRNTLGFRVQGSWISGYAGDVAPPFDRFYMGGDQDLRGFDIRSVSPVVFFPTAITIPLQNPDGTHGSAGSDEPAARNVERHHSGQSDHLPGRRHQLGWPISSIACRSSVRSRWRRLSIREWTSSPTPRNLRIASTASRLRSIPPITAVLT